jgi:hypothetical protein
MSEKLGIPAMVFTRKGFSQVVGNAYAGFGFAPEGPSIYEFPLEMFLPGSDLTPIKENIDKIVYGLTKWEPKTKTKGIFYPADRIAVQGKDYKEALTNMNLLFMRNLWGDGLPILPPTDEQVNLLLTGTDLPRDAVVGNMLPRGGILTAETIAIALAMAGGRPEYLPVLIAIVKAYTEPPLLHQNVNATTCNVYPVAVVNGPVAKQIRLNAGYGAMGPDPVHPAGATIGRALRLLQMNVGGAIPGSGTMAIHGAASRYTNVIFAEDEEGIPKTWKSLSAERGYPKGANAVTVYAVATTDNVNGAKTSTKEVAIETLDRLALIMQSNYGNLISQAFTPKGSPGFVVLPSGLAKGIQDNLGWSKEDLQKYLWEKTKIPLSIVKKDTYLSNPESIKLLQAFGINKDQPWPISISHKNILVVVSGGDQAGHAVWMRVGCCPGEVTDAEVKLPKAWDSLLKQAEKELGPAPVF